MKLRKQDKFKIDHINTERLKKSAIPHMKRILNEHYNNEKENKN